MVDVVDNAVITAEEYDALLAATEARQRIFEKCFGELVFPSRYTTGLDKRLIAAHRANLIFAHPYPYENTMLTLTELYPDYTDIVRLTEHIAAWAHYEEQNKEDAKNRERCDKLKAGDVVYLPRQSMVGIVDRKLENLSVEALRWKGDKTKAYMVNCTVGNEWYLGNRITFADELIFVKAK